MGGVADGAYARAGVDQLLSGNAVAALVNVLSGIRTGRPSRTALESGHYANVLTLDENRGLALSCDSVGSKVIVCEQLGRYDTIGIDLFGMNANDVICVGADPIALLDYIAVEEANPEVLEQIGIGLRAGAEQAGVEIPGGELAVLPDVVRGHPSPRGFDLVGFCVGLVELDAVVTGDRIEPGDTLIGIPSSGIHSNGLSLARNVLTDLDEEIEGQTVGDMLLEPTMLYVRAIRELLASELYEVFNMGCGFCVVVPRADADAAVELLAAHHPGTAVIGQATTATGVVELPRQGLIGRRGEGFRPAS